MASDPVVIIGAGLTGLSAAVALKRRGRRVIVLESAARAGGAVETESEGGFLVEHGPNSLMVEDPAVMTFLRDAGLEDEMLRPQAGKRFIVRGGRPVPLPSGPAGAVTTPIFSLPAKLRILAEAFIRRENADDESLANFVRRRLGSEVLAYAVEPFVAGIYAGNPETLSARHAFPKLWNLEREHGSFLRGALRLRRTGAPQKMMAFREGMGTLPRRLSGLLGGDLHCNAQVENIARDHGRWVVRWSRNGGAHEAAATELVSAVPAFAVPQLPWPEELGTTLGMLQNINYPPVTIVALGFPRSAVRHPLDGFGVLVPAVEKRRILGVIFSSSLFPGRAPQDHVLLTTFAGGSRQPEIAALPDEELGQIVRGDLSALLGVEGPPSFTRIIRWRRAIPQYEMGYGAILDALEKLEAVNPGLHLAGNYRGGIAAGRCILNGCRLAEKIAAAHSS